MSAPKHVRDMEALGYHQATIEEVMPKTRRAVDDNVVRTGRRNPKTSHDAGARKLPRSGTQRRVIYDLIATMGPLCDHELEVLTHGLHQSVSSTRNSLMNDGWIIDSTVRRRTPQGNFAIAWKINPEQRETRP